MDIKIFRMCGVLQLIPLILALSLITGCIDLSSQSLHSSSASAPDLQPAEWSGQLRMEIDPELRGDLFSLRGDAALASNSTLPYLLLNATLRNATISNAAASNTTLRQKKSSVVSTKYLLLNLEPNRDYSFEIAKNIRLLPGEYICTLEASGPSGLLASESRKCSLEGDRMDLISAKNPSGVSISPSTARTLYSGRPSNEYEEIERSIQRESPSKEERYEREKREDAGSEERSGKERGQAKDAQSSSPSPKLQASGNEEKREEADESKAETGAGQGGAQLEEELKADSKAPDIDDDAADYADWPGREYNQPGTIISAAGADMSSERAEEEPGGQFVGSKSSKKYHLPGCRFAQKIKPENKITFLSVEEAESQGYLPCKSCHP